MFKLKKSILILSMVLLVLISISTVTATDITADTNTDTVLENTNEINLDTNSNNNGSSQENIAKTTNDCLANNEEKLTILPANITPNNDTGENSNQALKSNDNNDSFTALDSLINGTKAGGILNLEHDYIMYADEVDIYKEGIAINKAITINVNGFTINANKTGRIFDVTGNLTLINGKFTNGNTTSYGGVIYSNGTVTVVNSTFIDNNARSCAGAIYNNGGNFTVFNSTFTNNNANYGGVIYNNKGTNSTVINSTFRNNKATNNCGVIYNNGANFTVINSTFTNNRATNNCGVIYNNKGTNFIIVNSTFTNNNATNGGVIYNYGTDFTITDSTFTNNNASNWGGVIYNYGANFTIVNSTFTSNNATRYGVLYNGGANFIVSNSIFTSNLALNGGVIYNYGVNFTVFNSIFANNIVSSNASVIYNTGDNFTIVNSIFTDNSAGYGGVVYNLKGSLLVFNSLFNNNNASNYAGAIYVNKGCNLTVINSEFLNNNANNGRGGAIYSNSTKILILNSTFAYNTATSYGGAIQFDTNQNTTLEDLIVNNCTFYYNVAGIDGSAIFSYATVNVTDCLFDFNSVVGEKANGGTIYLCGNNSLVDNCLFSNNYATLHGGAIYLASNITISNSIFYNNTAGDYAGAILVDGDNNLISNCDFKYNNAPKSTVIGVYKGYNLNITDCTNEDNTTVAEIFLATNETSLTNVEVVVLDNSTIETITGTYINLTAMVYSGGLSVAGGNLTFFDGVNYYTAESLTNGTYISTYLADYTNTRVINAQFSNALNLNVKTGAINTHKITLKVNDVIMYYKNGAIVAVLLKDDEPLIYENITITLNSKVYTLTTNEYGLVMMPIGLNVGKYNVTTTYDYITVNSTLTVLPTITGEDIYLYYRSGEEFKVELVNGYGQAIANQIVKMNINGIVYERLTNEKGIASLPIGLNPGNYTITCENPINGEKTSNQIMVLPTIIGEDITLYYRNGSAYSVEVFNKDGSIARHVNVTMNVNGVFYTVETDDNGIASLLIGLNVGEYIITTEYQGFKTSNKITVLPVLIGEDLCLYYRDGTKYSVKVLDNQGSPVIGVSVTMNINGVFYNLTTDALGVASLPIGLFLGTYIVTTTYNGYSASNFVTVLEREI